MIYLWEEMWDGGTHSGLFKDYYECCAAALEHAREYQITERDLKRREERNEAFIFVMCYDIDNELPPEEIWRKLNYANVPHIEGQFYDLRSNSKYIYKN